MIEWRLYYFMPPESLPWDRKDFFKERKHERSESLGSVARWRDSSSSSYHHGSRAEFARWGSAEFRRPPGHGKQGGWHLFSEEVGHGYAASRSSDKMLEDESCRPSSRSGDVRYVRSSRENRGSSYSQKDWKGHSWETSNGSPSPAVGRPLDVNNDQRPVDDMLTYNSHHHSDLSNGWNQVHPKDQHNKMGNVNGLVTSQTCERENSMGVADWKPFKWSRSGSLSSRGSGFSHSSSSKSIGADSIEAKTELQTRSVTPGQSPSGDAVACVTSAALSEETSSRKKPRLGWGEGLAKYEKKKTVGPDEGLNRNGIEFSDCASPATPSSVACSSSPGIENRLYVKESNTDNDTSHLSGSPVSGFQNHFEGFSFNLENLEANNIANIGSSLIELLQSEEQTAVDSNFVRSTAMNKLLIWKADVSKALEITESEIDLLENELKSLKAESGSGVLCPAVSCSPSVEAITKPCEEQGMASSLLPRPAPLRFESSRDMIVEKTSFDSGALIHDRAEAKDEDMDSPGTATSKFVEPLSLAKADLSSDMVKHAECHGDVGADGSTDEGVESSARNFNREKIDLPASADGGKLIESTGSAPGSSDCSLSTNGDDTLCNLILASNRESAYRASELFNKLLPEDKYQSSSPGAANDSSWQDDLFIRKKFAARKRFLRFKERVITLKFRAFQHLWKEDLRLLSIRKNRARSQKRFELSSRTSHSGYQKHRSSIRARFYSHAGNLSLVPTSEMINFTSKLLSDSQVKPCRNTLKMPALILDKKEKLASMFTSSNGLVEDPCTVEKERAMINPWTAEEKKIFIDNLAAFGKDFRKIASFLDHKTTADCVEYYYKNHKEDCFKKTKKKPEIRNQGKPFCANTYLLTSEKKWNREINAASLDMLGEASVIAAHADASAGNRQTCSGRFFLGGFNEYKTPQGGEGILERSSSFDIMVNERETAAADVLAGICGSLSSEAMSSCITSSADPGEGYQDWKSKKVGSVRKRPLTPEVTQIIEDETCSDESCGEMGPSDWTDEEKSRFIQAISSYGKDFAKISRCVRTRSAEQCKIFFSKARKCLGLDRIHPRSGYAGPTGSDDADGGGSDTEDACNVQTGSVICSSKLSSEMDEDFQLSGLNMNAEESDLGETTNLQTNLNMSEENNGTGEVDHMVAESVENLVNDECQLGNRPELVFEGDNIIVNGVDNKSLMIHVKKDAVVSAASEDGRDKVAQSEDGRDKVTQHGMPGVISVSTAEAPFLSRSDSVVQSKPLAVVSVQCDQTEEDGGEILLPEICDREEKHRNADTIGQRSLTCSIQDTNTSENAPLVAADKSSCAGFSASADSLHHTSLELDSTQKHIAILSQHNSLLMGVSLSQDSVDVQNDKTIIQEDALSSTLGLENKNKQCQKSASRDDHDQLLSGHPVLNHVDSSQILRGYPLQIPTKKELNEDVNSRKPSVPSLKKYTARDCFLQKCNRSNSHSSMAELPLRSQNLEQLNHHHHHLKAHSGSSSDPEEPGKNGDFKLFGQILSNPSSVQKPISVIQENDDKTTHHPKSSSKSINLKFSGHHSIDGGTTTHSKFDRANYLGLENFGMSYGYWDGNRIQTGFPALPESAILLAKYPAALSNYPPSSSKIEQQQPLQAVVKSNGCNLNGVSVLPTREISNGKVATDYQVYRSRDANRVQSFAADLQQQQQQQRQELLLEMQRRNGLDGISSLQHQHQQGRGVVGMNVVGRAGILVSGACPAVSDPVAAIKRHYAKSEQYGGQTGSIIREESWRSHGT